MSKSKRTLISLATMGLLTLAANARAEPAKGDAFTTDFEGASLAQWSVKVANERFASAVKIEPIDGRKAYQLTGPAIAELEDKPNEARVQLETIDGDAALHVQGPIASIKENILGRVTAFREATVTRYEVLAALPKLRTDTFDLEVDIKGVGGVQFGGGFKVYIGKVGDIGTLMYQTPMQGVKRIGLRYLSLNKWNRLKVVCTPSFVRIYRAGSLVGNVVINRKQGWPKGVSKAPIALFGQDAYFDDLRVSAAPSPLDASIVVPALPQNVRPEAVRHVEPTGFESTALPTRSFYLRGSKPTGLGGLFDSWVVDSVSESTGGVYDATKPIGMRSGMLWAEAVYFGV